MTDFAPGLEKALERIPTEGSYGIKAVEGEVPAFVRGTYYLTGPARFSRGDLRYRHWLDGDGMVCALHFETGNIWFTNRFVHSDKWMAEERAGRALYRTFGTAWEGDELLKGVALASPVNVSVYPYAKTLLAFGEQGLPWELDPVTLGTRGLYTFNRRLNPVSPFAAHPRFDYATGEMLNFGVSFAADRPSLTAYRFDPFGDVTYRKRHRLPFPCSLHDFDVSARRSVFYLAPYLMDMKGFLEGGRSVMEALSWQPERGTRLLVLDRATGEELATVPVGQGYCLHHVNAFDDEAGRLVVDVMELTEPVYKDYHPLPDLFVDVASAKPVRYVVDVDAGEVVERKEMDFSLAADFPAVDNRVAGKPYRHFWMLAISATGKPGRKFLDRLVHCDWEDGGTADVYESPAGRYLGGEPVCVGDARNPDRGAVIVPEYDAEADKSSFLLFDAYDVAKGPVARLPLQSPIHLGFHATFDYNGGVP